MFLINICVAAMMQSNRENNYHDKPKHSTDRNRSTIGTDTDF